MKQSSELEPCPCCGGEAKLIEKDICTGHGCYSFGAYVKCLNNDCGVRTKEFLCEGDYHFNYKDKAIKAWNARNINGDTSDGYHTFNELYHHRAVLFSVIVHNYSVFCWKSKKHHDGSMFDGMFIVGINTPYGQATYHYDIDPYWDMFDCKEIEYAPTWDGHTPEQAIERIGRLLDFQKDGE
jgi:hypothetical protein